MAKRPPQLQRNTAQWADFDADVLRNPDLPASAAKAQLIAATVHQGQTDQNGQPYLQHPAAVVDLAHGLPEYQQLDPHSQDVVVQAAWLHDTLEDTALTTDDLRVAGFSDTVIDTVVAVTSHDDETKAEYYQRVRNAGPLALIVKLADLTHNTLPSRRDTLPGSPTKPITADRNSDPDADRWTTLGVKYANAYGSLGLAVPTHLRQFLTTT